MLKRLINLCGSILVAAFDWLYDLANRLLGRSPRGACVVLAYHSVASSERDWFARQMDVLRTHTTPVAANIADLPNRHTRYSAVTFDDGLENIVINALPVLAERMIPATLFLVTGALGTNPSWEYFGGDDPSQQRVMTEQQLQTLSTELVTIGSHTMTHPMLPSLNRDSMKRELSGSRGKLEALSGREVKLFSFPYGAFDKSVVQACRDARYERVFTALPVFAFQQPNEFVTGRVGVRPTDWPIEFRLKLAGAYRWLPYAFALKRKTLCLFRLGHAPALVSQGETRGA